MLALYVFSFLLTHAYLSAAKKSRDEEQAKRDANDRDISEYFTKGATKVQPKPKVCFSQS
jgi:hypothetical protein